MNRGNTNSTQRLLPNGMIDPCAGFAANLFRNWRRDVKLRRSPQAGASAAKLISKISTTLPANSRMGVLSYIGSTENVPQSRTANRVMDMPNRRFGETDSERAWSRLSSFADFKRGGVDNIKDFWTRFTSCVARLNAHGLAVSEPVVFHRAIQALRVPGCQLPILLAKLETFPTRHRPARWNRTRRKCTKPIAGKLIRTARS